MASEKDEPASAPAVDESREPAAQETTPVPLEGAPAEGTRSVRAGASGSPAPQSSRPSRRAPAQVLFGPGQTIAGRYRVVRFISRGAMGEVYEVEDTALRGRVALKTIRPEIAEDPKIVERFRHEIHLARKVTHPNACRIFDLGVHQAPSPPGAPGEPPQEVFFLTMEMLVGESLSQRLARTGRMTPAEALPIVAQLAAGLDAAHAMGVIHRDFKSGNVMLVAWPDASRGIRAVITDFGLAHGAGGDESLASISDTGVVVGTPAYMAPEQVQGKALTPAADLYALGVVMYEMMTGGRPFDGGSAISVAVKRLSEAPPPPRSIVPDLPPAWESVILRCLERDPAARFADGAEIVKALSEPQAIPAAPAAAAPPPRRLRLSGRALGAVVGAMLAVAAILTYSRLARRPAPGAAPTTAAPSPSAAAVAARRALAVLGLRNASGQPADAWLQTAIAEMLTTDLAAGGKLRTIPTQEVAQARRDLGLAEVDEPTKGTLSRLRESLGADLVAIGAYTIVTAGENRLLRIDLRLYDTASGELLAPGAASGTEGQLFDLVSRAGSPLREKLGLPAVTPAQALEVEASLPSNREARRLYTEGLAKLQVSDALAARQALEKAVAAEPKHPLPHAALAEAWSLLGYDAKAEKEAKAALALAGSLPAEQKLAIQARADEIGRRWEKAIETYRALAAASPDDLEYGLRLAEAQISAGKAREAVVTAGALRKLPHPVSDDPRIDLVEARAWGELADFKQEQRLAAAAATKAKRRGTRLLLARARLVESHALGGLGETARSSAAVEEARSLYQAAGDNRFLARTLNEMAIALYNGGDLEGARRLLERSLQIARGIGDRRTTAAVLHNLGNVMFDQGQGSGARKLYAESLGLYREIGAGSDVSDVLNDLGARLFVAGDLEGAMARYREALTVDGETGDKKRTARTLTNLGEALFVRGDLAQAENMHEESLAICREIGDKDVAGYDLYRLGLLSTARGDLRAARSRYDEALALQKQLGDQISAAQTRLGLAWVTMAEGHASEAEALAREAEEALRTGGASDAAASAQAVLAEALLAGGKAAEARKIADRAAEVAGKSEDRTVRMAVAVSAARVRAASQGPEDVSEALRSLEATRAEAAKLGFLLDQYQARLAIGEIEMASGKTATGRVRLQTLAKEAEAKGFGLVARKASARLGA